jgi:signal peptidase II
MQATERSGTKPSGLRGRSRRRAGAWGLAGLILFGVVAADQLTTHVVEHSVVPGEERKLLPGLELVSTRNRGVAFGLLPGSHLGVTLLIGVALLILVVYFARHASQRLIWLPTGMLLGGALGNIIDRLRNGWVTDFIKLPLGWPPFNLADMSIVLGVVLLFLLVDHQRRAGQ